MPACLRRFTTDHHRTTRRSWRSREGAVVWRPKQTEPFGAVLPQVGGRISSFEDVILKLCPANRP